ncbi:MAG: hypothetical protein SGBAC_005346 [Bacillariaceae sp.]
MEHSKSSQKKSQEQQAEGSGRTSNAQVMQRGRIAVEVTMWSAHCSTLLIRDGCRALSVVIYKSCIAFGRDCLDYWCYSVCHSDTAESCTTFFQWREEGIKIEAMSWKSLLVDGPITVVQRVYPAIVKTGRDVVIPTTALFLRLVGELSILLCQIVFGITLTLTPWALALIWPDRRHKSSKKGSFAVVVVVGGGGGHPCEVGNSFGYHIDVSAAVDGTKTINQHDGDMTTVSEITHDEASWTSDGQNVPDLCGDADPVGDLGQFPAPAKKLGSQMMHKLLAIRKPSTEQRKPFIMRQFAHEDMSADDEKPAAVLQRHPMAAIRSKLKKSTGGLKSNGILLPLPTKLRRSLLKQTIV